MPRGGILPPAPVLAPGSALRSRPRVALSSAQAPAVYRGPRPPGNAGAGSAARTTGQETPPGRRARIGRRLPAPPAPRGGLSAPREVQCTAFLLINIRVY